MFVFLDKEATKKAYSYLLLDFHPTTPDLEAQFSQMNFYTTTPKRQDGY